MRVFLMRHGETTGDVEGRYGGDYDDHLTEKGKKQSLELAKRLEESEISTLYVSPKARAVETALIISKNLPFEVEAISMPDLRERNNYGALTGMKKSEAKKNFPEEVSDLEENSPYHHVKGTEDYYDFSERILGVFNEIVQEEFEKETAAIGILTHGGPIMAIFREILGFEVKGVKDCALFELEYDGEGFEIISAEDVESMESGLR
jgi:probable phosphoglycerate mutase